MRRYSTSNWYTDQKIVEVDQHQIEKGKESCISITDKNSFVPNSEIMKKARAGAVNGQALYDFENGKDNGMKVPVSRIKGKDIAELSEEIQKQQKKVKDKIDEAKAKAETEANAKASLEAYKNALKGENTTSNS